MFKKSKIKQIKKIKEIQKQNIDRIKDDYMVGIYNGLELAVAIMEEREPEFVCTVSDEHPCIESEPETLGRTVASGIIRRGTGL